MERLQDGTVALLGSCSLHLSSKNTKGRLIALPIANSMNSMKEGGGGESTTVGGGGGGGGVVAEEQALLGVVRIAASWDMFSQVATQDAVQYPRQLKIVMSAVQDLPCNINVTHVSCRVKNKFRECKV
jgi:hypothetical protein